MRRALLIAAMVSLGCGYRFTAGGAPLPGGVKSVCAPVYLNRTAEAGLELAFTDALRRHLVRVGKLDSACEGKITGELVNVWAGPTVFTNYGALASYRIYAHVILRLHQGEKLLGEANVVGWEDYLPALETRQDVLAVESNRQAALRRLSDSLARDAYEKLANAW